MSQLDLTPPSRKNCSSILELAGLFSSFFAAVLASSGEGTILYSSSSLKEAPCITYAYGSFLYFFSTLFCLDFMLSKGSKNVIYSKMPHDAGSILNKWDLSGISMIPRLSLKHTSTSLMEYPPWGKKKEVLSGSSSACQSPVHHCRCHILALIAAQVY